MFTIEYELPKEYKRVFSCAKDRREFVRNQFGSWFEDNSLKLTRDYMVTTCTRSLYAQGQYNHGYKDYVRLEIRDPTKALLFKLTWGGSLL